MSWYALSFVRAHPVDIRSYLWRTIALRTGLASEATVRAWAGEADHVEVKQALSVRLIAEIRAELEAHGLEYFFLLFHARRALSASGPYGWQEPLLYEELRRHGIRFVSSKRVLRADMARTGRAPDSYYHTAHPGLNHYTAEANAILFGALREGVEGRFEPYEYLAER